MKILIVTTSSDNEAVACVDHALRRRGAEPIRLDTDRFPTEIRLSLSQSNEAERIVIHLDGRSLDFAELDAVWYRRTDVAGRLPQSMPQSFRQPSMAESRASLYGALACFKGLVIDRLEVIRAAESKPVQLGVARALGLDVPRTLTTNDPAEVTAFASTCASGLITKMLSSFAIREEGKERVVFTNAMRPEDLDDLSGLRLCPMTFQEKLPKAIELRSTVLGDRVITAAVESQQSERGSVDWRRDGVGLAQAWRPYQLPAALEKKLVALVRTLGLTYSAADFVVTPEGRHVFLESNPCGEWLWLKESTGDTIPEAIADALTSGAHAT